MKKRNWATALACIYGAGAVTMYFLDPQRGRRRRVVLKDALVHSGHELQRFSDRFRRDFAHRAEGALAETKGFFRDERVSDAVLQQRVRAILGRLVSHPHAIEVDCKDGAVTLKGWVLADELPFLEKAIQSVRGAEEVATFLNTTDHPEHVSGLQGGTRRKYLPEFLQENWSPTARVSAGAAGLGLIAYGLSRRNSTGAAAGLGGTALVIRSLLNIPWRQITGAAPAPGLRIDKTVHIAASPSDLYEFWANPENYPRVFTHVKQVSREGEGAYRWHLTGPAGMPLTWTGTITRKIPGKLVEWRSVPGSVIENHGVVRLDEAKDGRTRVQVQMSYTPPAGLLGHALATILGVDPKHVMDQDFVQLKAVFDQGVTRVRRHDIMAAELKPPRPAAS